MGDGSEDLDSTMNVGAVHVKLKFMREIVDENKGKVEELEKFKTQQEGMNKSYEKFKDNMTDLKIESRLGDLEKYKETQRRNKNNALERKQSNMAIWAPIVFSILMFLYLIYKEASG